MLQIITTSYNVLFLYPHFNPITFQINVKQFVTMLILTKRYASAIKKYLQATHSIRYRQFMSVRKNGIHSHDFYVQNVSIFFANELLITKRSRKMNFLNM